MLSDGTMVRFRSGETEMRRQLPLNEDHYATAAHQLAYVSSRYEAQALHHIGPRMQEDAANPYKTILDVLDYGGHFMAGEEDLSEIGRVEE
jgi:hypothetical protein